jgi:soluble lytic murein transglycosylase-like protein
MRRLILVFSTAALVSLSAVPASAELIYFATGRTLSVKGHRMEGDQIVLLLRGGGEITCGMSLIRSIEPDEVPYPEPEPAPVSIGEGELQAGGVPYGDIIDQVAAEQNVDPRLVRAVIQVESAFQPTARSHKGAMGLMQLMPQTAQQYSVQNPYEPRANIEAGIRHLKSLLDRFELSLALAAYNAGEAAVRRFGGVPPYRETQQYVARILQLIKS